MSKIFVVASGKGGVGKSTVTACLAKVLAAMKKRVLIIDMDTGLAGLDVMMGVGERNVFSWMDIMEENCKIIDAIIAVNNNLGLIAAPNSYINNITKEDFRKAMSGILEMNFDFIFFDAPAGLGSGLQLASTFADRALIVTTSDDIATRAARNVRETLEELGVKQSRLIINRFRRKPTIKGDYLNIDASIDASTVQLIGIIPEDYGIQHISMNGRLLKTKKGTGAAFTRIAKRLCGEMVELEIKKF